MRVFALILLTAIAEALPLNDSDSIPIFNEDLFEGDIAGIDPSERNIVTNRVKLWPDNIVYYEVDSKLYNKRYYIEKAMGVYEEISNGCIKFRGRNGNRNYVHIKIHNGCYSYIGMSGGEQILSLGKNCYDSGTILHELGHALGFFHEHTRSDRDKYVKIFPKNIQKDTHNFEKLKDWQNYLVTPYDFDSIMQYGSYVDAISKTRPTILKINGDEIPPPFYKKTISKLDLKELLFLYGCPGGDIDIKYPNIGCNFTKDMCSLQKMRGQMTASMKLSNSTGNEDNHLVIESDGSGKNQARVNIDIVKYFTEKICLSFRYNIQGPNLNRHTMTIYSIDLGQTERIALSQTTTDGWVEFKQTLTPPKSVSQILWNMYGDGSNPFKVLLDDLKYQYKEC